MCLLLVCVFFVHVFIFLHHPVIKLQFLKLAFFFFFKLLTIREINIGCSKDMDGWGLNQRPWLPQRVELGNYIL